MPDYSIQQKPLVQKKPSHIFGLILLITVLLIVLIALSGTLFFYLKYGTSLPSIINTTTPVNNVNSGPYSKLEDSKCRDDSEYSNVLIPSIDLDAYDRNNFYVASLDKNNIIDKISKNETLLTEFILWDDDTTDSLSHTGRALVCIKGKDKIATVQFTTDNSKLKNPVRYKDPERSITNVLIQAFYMIPNGSIPKVDWQDKIKNNLLNIQNAQKRIFNGESKVDFRIYPEVVYNRDLDNTFLTQIAKGIVTKDKNNEIAIQPVDFIYNNYYTAAQTQKYPNFYESPTDSKFYNQVSTMVYFEVGGANARSAITRGNESGYAFISPALDNGNFFGIIGTNLSRDISIESSPYHEFMHTLGLPDEYPYKDGSIQRTPTNIFKGRKQLAATLMQDPYQASLNTTYIDDQERVLMGIKD